MTTYTRKQITEARNKADSKQHHLANTPGHDWVVDFAAALGLEVGPDKPSRGRGTSWQVALSRRVPHGWIL